MKTKLVGLFVGLLLITNMFVIIDAKKETFEKEKHVSVVFSEPSVRVTDQYATLHMDEATSYLSEPGKPVLPLCTKIFTFPFGTTITGIDCTPSQITQQGIFGEIPPAQARLPLTSTNTRADLLIKNATIYDSANFFPSDWFQCRVGCGLYHSRHTVMLTVRLCPVRYSPGRQMIEVARTINITIHYHEPTHPNVVSTKCDMVIITPAEFSPLLQPLVDYKNDSGVVTKLVTLDEIYTGFYFPVSGRDNQEKIKYFIKDAIEAWNTTYVLLAGGANKVPVRMSYIQDGYEVNFSSDLYYADIYDANGDFCSWDSNGNNIFGEYGYQGNTDVVDLYPDVHLGRLNFRDSSEVSGVVNKIITYESTGAYMDDWFFNFVTCGGDTFPDYAGINEGEYLNQNAIDMMDGFTPEKIWASNGKLEFAINIDNAIANGTGLLYMTGHGTYENWATHPHNDFQTWWPIGSYFYLRAELLNNGEKLPIFLIGGCSNCLFLNDHCFGWSFVKNPDGGGIASYGNTGVGWSSAGTGCSQGLTGGMELSAIKAYGIQHANTTGELWTNALDNYLDDFGAWSGLDYKTLEEWQSFADPSVRITKVSDRPNKPEKIMGPSSGEIGKAYSFTTSASDVNGDLIKYCFDWGDTTHTWTGLVNSGDHVSVNHTWTKPGNYTITVKARDTFGLDSAWSDPWVINIRSEAPYLEIEKITGGVLKVKTVLVNTGLLAAQNVSCNITVKGGMLGMIRVSTENSVDILGVQEEKTIASRTIFGVGKINISVTASAPSSNIVTSTAHGLVIGPLVIVRS